MHWAQNWQPPFKRVNLPPPTNQKNGPQDMVELDRMLEKMKIENNTRSMERLDKWLAEHRQAMGL